MRIADIMTPNPACCTPESSLQDVARIMLDEDCGSVPVCESHENKRVIGMITDRDIVIRAIAAGRNPLDCQVQEFMTHPVAVVQASDELDRVINTLEDNQIRRVPVIDNNQLVGIIAQADIARSGNDSRTGELVQEISQ